MVYLRGRGERIYMPELCLSLMVREMRERRRMRACPLSYVVGGGLYRVRHPPPLMLQNEA